MGTNTWMYHDEHGGKIVDSDDVPMLEKEGWRDSPAKLPVVAVDDKPKKKEK